ncbi:MAG: helix-turn-helix domain-containing protein [Spirochaetales bacterium]|nr:helix-turn-helix domain-containing protein [Spirochaetales bacterium]
MERGDFFNVIIAEDEHRIRENLVKKVSEAHPRFRIAGAARNGQEALEMTDGKTIHLLITDIKMPIMDGLALIEELYFTRPEISVIILSGYDEFSYAKRAIHFGVKDYILKPVSKKELYGALERLEIILDKNNQLLSDDIADYNSGSAAEELCGKIVEYLKLRYTDNISIAELSDSFNLNPTYLSRVFKQITGRTPTRFLTDLRINEARRLLTEQPELEVKEVAVKLGFSDQGYFSRLFKKETGKNPLEYRKLCRQQQF